MPMLTTGRGYIFIYDGSPMTPSWRSASLILPRLYLSDFGTAQDEGVLSDLGITHVVSALERTPTLPDSIPTTHRLHLCIADYADVDILTHLEETTEFIRRALDESQDNKVLVHCVQGVSRSTTIVCAYLIATSEKSMSASEAIRFVRSKRNVVCPNLGFRNQLEKYATRFVGREPAHPLSAKIAEKVRQLKALEDGVDDLSSEASESSPEDPTPLSQASDT